MRSDGICLSLSDLFHLEYCLQDLSMVSFFMAEKYYIIYIYIYIYIHTHTPQEKGMITCSSILAWRIPWIEATAHGSQSQTQLSD